MSILYDYPTLENEYEETISQIHAFIDRMSAASAPGAHLVDLFPWMIYIPERYVSISFIILSDHPERGLHQIYKVETGSNGTFSTAHIHVQRAFGYRSQ